MRTAKTAHAAISNSVAASAVNFAKSTADDFEVDVLGSWSETAADFLAGSEDLQREVRRQVKL